MGCGHYNEQLRWLVSPTFDGSYDNSQWLPYYLPPVFYGVEFPIVKSPKKPFQIFLDSVATMDSYYCPKCTSYQPIVTRLTYITFPGVQLNLACKHIIDIVENAFKTSTPEPVINPPPPEPSIPLSPDNPEVEPIRDERWTDFYPYQQAGVEFTERSGFRCLIGDEMGLGKTIQAIGAIRYNQELLTPCLVICPASLIYKWQNEFKKWYSDRYKSTEDIPFIQRNNGYVMEGQNIYIISNSLIAKEGLLTDLLAYGFKTLIVDESHQFKNDNANRTNALLSLSAKIPYKILLSGTSILNRTSEYFNSLTIIHNEHWPNRRWLDSYCSIDRNGKVLGLDQTRKQAFFNRTKDYIIRRRKSEVLTDLPEKQVNYTYISLNDQEGFIKGYNKLLDELEELIQSIRSKMGQSVTLLAIMSQMRHLVGVAKVRVIADQIVEFLENTEGKICIGTHHTLVRQKLAQLLAEYRPLEISDEGAAIKMDRINTFRTNDDRRVIIASIIGAGIGLDIQFCPNVVMMEREWNKSIEDQFEGRFHRIGSVEKVVIDYVMAKETIDEYYDERVKLTGQISGSVLDQDFAIDNKFMLELAESMVQKRMKYVG